MDNNAYLEALKPREKGVMPIISARRLTGVAENHPIHDASFEGLEKRIKQGKEVWEVGDNVKIRIEAKTGFCQIPDTVNNRERLKMISKPRQIEGTRVVTDPQGNVTKEPEMITLPPMYEVLDDVMKQKMASTMMEKVFEGIDADTLANILASKGLNVVPTSQVQPPPPEPTLTEPPNVTINEETLHKVEEGVEEEDPEPVAEEMPEPEAEEKPKRKYTPKGRPAKRTRKNILNEISK